MSKVKFAIISIISIILVLGIAVFSVYITGGLDTFTSEPTEIATEPTQLVIEIEPPTEPDVTEVMLSGMTLEEKVAQMVMVSCHDGINIEAASSYGVGGICLYEHSFTDKTADEVKAMVDSYNALSNVPMLISVDEEGGTVNRVSTNPNLRATPFLSPLELKEQGGLELVRSDTIEKADLLSSFGRNVNLAPVCDVPLDETNYIYDRCYSLDHDETAKYVETVVTAMKEKGIGSSLKHFPGYGGSVDTHQSMSYDTRDYSAFENGDFKPFIAGINAGADCVLVSHNIVACMDEEMPASLSKPVHDILRGELKFDGVIITDDLVMEGIVQFTDGENAAVFAVKAGNDMIICNDYQSAVNAIMQAVNDGEIEETQIDESVKRILNWKKSLNILE